MSVAAPVVALFDMDRTLVDTHTAKLYVRYQRDLGEIGPLQTLRTSYWLFQYTLGVINAEQVAMHVLESYRGKTDDWLQERCQRWFQSHVRQWISSIGRARVREQQLIGERGLAHAREERALARTERVVSHGARQRRVQLQLACSERLDRVSIEQGERLALFREQNLELAQHALGWMRSRGVAHSPWSMMRWATSCASNFKAPDESAARRRSTLARSTLGSASASARAASEIETRAALSELVEVALVTNNGMAVFPGTFFYNALPTLTSVLPTSGDWRGGTVAQVRGTGFVLSSGINEVFFGSKKATNLVVKSDTLLTCRVPSGTPGTTVTVLLRNPNGSASLCRRSNRRRWPVSRRSRCATSCASR